jgi:hypothetical protein
MFHVKRILTVSHFRLPLLKRLVPAGLLATLDGLCQPTGAWWQLTPSIFLQCQRQGTPAPVPAQLTFRCPACGSLGLAESARAVACRGCGRRWPVEEGIYNFKSSS